MRDAARFHTVIATMSISEENNNAQSKYMLGYLYEDGKGVTADANEAVKWYRQAAAGVADAMESLGALYFFGKGVTQDYAEAAKWYKVPAEKGSTYAQYLLGYLYEDGKGVRQDAIQAQMWSNLTAYQLSGEEGERIGKVRDFIASKLAPDQLAKAQELARNWQPKK
jgi:uncharacterized protein